MYIDMDRAKGWVPAYYCHCWDSPKGTLLILNLGTRCRLKSQTVQNLFTLCYRKVYNLSMHKLIVDDSDTGKRIDNVVTKRLVGFRPELEISRSLIQDMIQNGWILLNGEVVKVSHRVKNGDIIEIDYGQLEKASFLERDKKIPKGEDIQLEIIYEDSDILVVNKPAGMVVHPACGNYSGTLVNALLNYPGFPKDLDVKNSMLRPGIVHRLDKDTSGIILIAKTRIAHRKLSRQLKNRTIVKKYIAVVKGIVELDEGVINAPISHSKKDRRRMVVDEEGKESITYYRVVIRDKEKNFTVLEVEPKTGRTHQIRVHLSHIGHPILGDVFYNGPAIPELSRQALHAKSIRFIHPTKNTLMELTAAIPFDLKRFLYRLRF